MRLLKVDGYMQRKQLICASGGLQKDKVNVRLKAVALLGRLFAHPSRQFAQEYPLVFSEFLKRFSDKVVEVRVAVVNCAKSFMEANPTDEQANEILGESHMVPKYPVNLLGLSPCISHAIRVPAPERKITGWEQVCWRVVSVVVPVLASCVIAYLCVILCVF